MPNPDLAAANEITRRVYEYAYGIDTRNWSLYRSIFTDEIDIDFSSYNGEPGTRMQADDWVSNVQILFTGLAATQHTMTNPLVDQPGPNNARCRKYMQAEHFLHPEGTLATWQRPNYGASHRSWRTETRKGLMSTLDEIQDRYQPT